MSWSLTHGFHIVKKKKHKIQAREINKPGLCLKDPPKAPEPDQPIQNTPADQESDKFE